MPDARCLMLVLLVLLSIASPSPAFAGTKTLLILVSGYSVDDLRGTEQFELLKTVARKGSAGMVIPAADGEPSQPAALLSVGAGVPIAAPGETGPRFLEGNVERTVADLAADIFPAVGVEGDIVCRAYRRRMGTYPPLDARAVHVSLPALLRAQDRRERARLGALGDILRKAHLSVGVYGDWTAALVAMDRRGVLWEGALKPLGSDQLERLMQDHDLMIVSAETLADMRRYTRVGLSLADAGTANVLVACVAPPCDDGKWRGVGFLFAVGPAFPAHGLLSSTTTRLPGAVSALDFGPTLFALLGVAEPFGGSGNRMEVTPSDGNWNLLLSKNDRYQATSRARPVVWITHLVLAVLAPLVALLGIWFSIDLLMLSGRFGMRAAAASPLAFLIIGPLAPDRIVEYVAGTLGICVLIAFGAGLLERWRRIAPLVLILSAGSLAILIDAVTGGNRAAQSVLGGYPFLLLLGLAIAALLYVFLEARMDDDNGETDTGP